MQWQRIMCPVDLERSSSAALDHAASLAKKSGAHLHIVTVDEVPLLSCAASLPHSTELVQRRTRLEQIVPRCRGVTYEHHLLRGKAADELVRFARRRQIDLAVVERNASPRGALGHRAGRPSGVTGALVASAPCSVLVVGAEAPEPGVV